MQHKSQESLLESYVTEIWNFWIVNNPSGWVDKLLYVPAVLTLKNRKICPKSVFVFSMDLTKKQQLFPRATLAY